jgi:hypothetical protein
MGARDRSVASTESARAQVCELTHSADMALCTPTHEAKPTKASNTYSYAITRVVITRVACLRVS